MLARLALASFALLAPLPALAQTPAPVTTQPATSAEAAKAPVDTAKPKAPLDRAQLRRACAQESEARGLHGKTKLRWQVKCRKGKTQFKPV